MKTILNNHTSRFPSTRIVATSTSNRYMYYVHLRLTHILWYINKWIYLCFFFLHFCHTIPVCLYWEWYAIGVWTWIEHGRFALKITTLCSIVICAHRYPTHACDKTSFHQIFRLSERTYVVLESILCACQFTDCRIPLISHMDHFDYAGSVGGHGNLQSLRASGRTTTTSTRKGKNLVRHILSFEKRHRRRLYSNQQQRISAQNINSTCRCKQCWWHRGMRQ